MISLKDRYLATLWGLHIGDSLWAPFENMNARQVRSLLQSHGGLKFHRYRNPWPREDTGRYLPAGRPTDDSDQTADLCHSLLTCNGVDQEHLTKSLQQSVVHEKSRLWSGKAIGAGRTTRTMLGDDPAARAATQAKPFASNGSLMRSAALALFQGPTPTGYPVPNGTDYHQVRAMSEVTHVHPNSIAVCWLFVRMLRNALAGRGIDDVKPVNKLDRRVLEYLEAVELYDTPLPPDPGSFKAGWGGAEYTLKVVLYTILTTESFPDCMKRIGLVGGDTDTYGAVAGALAGALYGVQEIPKLWRNTIFGKDQMGDYAEALYRHWSASDS